jgi:hypothetical protein
MDLADCFRSKRLQFAYFRPGPPLKPWECRPASLSRAAVGGAHFRNWNASRDGNGLTLVKHLKHAPRQLCHFGHNTPRSISSGTLTGPATGPRSTAGPRDSFDLAKV